MITPAPWKTGFTLALTCTELGNPAPNPRSIAICEIEDELGAGMCRQAAARLLALTLSVFRFNVSTAFFGTTVDVHRPPLTADAACALRTFAKHIGARRYALPLDVGYRSNAGHADDDGSS